MSIEQRGRLGDLCVTVATAANEAINLGTELELIKGVVLYADSIVVVSPQLNAMRDFAINTTSWGYGSPFAADDDPDAIRALTTYHRIRKGYGATDDEWLHMQEHKESLEARVAHANREVQRSLERLVGPELLGAVTTGVVSLEEIQTRSDAPIPLDLATLRRLVELHEPTGDGAVSIPLLDFMAEWQLRRSGTGVGSGGDRAADARELAVAQAVLGELPAFPEASMDELLNVRDTLRGPLVRFRGAMCAAAMEMGDIQVQDFERAAQAFYRREIAPALVELDESLEDLGASRALRRAGTAGVASIGICIASMLSISEFLATALVPAGAAVGAELKYRDRVKAEQKRNSYFYLWRADQLLSRRQER